MTALSAFGLVAVTLMLLFYAFERRGRWYTLAFAGACALVQRTDFFRVLGHLDLRRPFGPRCRPALVARCQIRPLNCAFSPHCCLTRLLVLMPFEKNGRPVRARTADLYRVKVAL
jgi:hypothetical protein